MPVTVSLTKEPFNKLPSDLSDDDVLALWDALSVDEKAKVFSQRTPLNNTILHWAIERGYIKTASKMIADGVNPNVLGEMQQTPLHLAAYYNYADLARQLLLAGASVNAARSDNEMPIHIAALMGSADVVDVILTHDMTQLNTQGREATTAFIRAVSSNKPRVIDVLLKYGDNIDQLNSHSGHGALHMAAIKNRHELVQYLLDRGANINLLSSNRLTPLQYCALQKKSSYMVAAKLISAGANIHAGDENTLDLLDRHGSMELAETKKLRELLVEKGAGVGVGPSVGPAI
jgi:ankyrin repeat protein